MTRPVLNFPYPEIGAKRKNEIKLLRADFGDGYTSISPDGINYQREVWDLTWPYMTRAQADTLWSFFEDTCGGGILAFNIQDIPGVSADKKYTCEVFDWTDKGADYVTITATIKQSFNLDD